MDYKEKAYGLLKAWRPEYTFGVGITEQVGAVAANCGKKVLLIANENHKEALLSSIKASLEKAGCTYTEAPGVKPNAPREDVYRLTTYLLQYQPEVIVAVGGGSTIDAAKAASVLATLGKSVSPEIDCYFGTGKVSQYLEKTGKKLIPVLAYEVSASSAAHLTKYSNITDPVVGQKKLIVDPAIVPQLPFFDYGTTVTMPRAVTIDGALDALAHTFEVFCGAKGENYALCQELAETAFSLVLEYAAKALEEPENLEAREALGLATDLGGYAIMVGGTSGGHLTSFSLVDCASHGTACGIMNPYYAVFYQKAIQPQLKVMGKIFQTYGYLTEDLEKLSGRVLATAVAKAMMAFSSSLGAPTTLKELPLFDEEIHVKRALSAAKDPDLKMKLQNMPVPLTAEQVDAYMAPILLSATEGDLDIIKEL